MRIEINAGGIGGAISVTEFESNMTSFINDAEKIISSFQTVNTAVASLNGGIGNLQSAFDDLSDRIQIEEERYQDAIEVRQKSNDFIDLAIRVDQEVAELVDQNKEEFYQVNPWLQPADDNIPWYEKVFQLLFDATTEVIKNTIAIELWKINLLKKAWDGLVSFYNEHKRVIDTILIVIGAVMAIAAIIFTQGMGLVYLLTVLGLSYDFAVAISATIGILAGLSTFISSIFNIVDIWFEISDTNFQTWKSGFNIASGILNFVYSIGTIFNSLKGVSTTESLERARAISNKKGYGNLEPSSRMKIESGREFSQKQKNMIREENMKRNGNKLRCDLTGEKLSIQPKGAKKIGQPFAEIDHIIPKSLGGFNSFDNAQVVLWKFNNIKRANMTLDLVKLARIHSLTQFNIDFGRTIFYSFPTINALLNIGE